MRRVMIIASAVLLGGLLVLTYRPTQPTHAGGGEDTWAENTFNPSAAEAPQADLFTGVIVKEGEEFVLQAGGTTYRLSDQAAASQFEGKRVRVRGTLDTSTNTIQVQEIEPLE